MTLDGNRYNHIPGNSQADGSNLDGAISINQMASCISPIIEEYKQVEQQ